MSILRSVLSVILLITLLGRNPLAKNLRISEKNYLSPVKSDLIDYRLPKNVVPTYYIIKLVPDIANRTFAGESHIDITVTESSIREIVLHAKDLIFDKEFTRLISGKKVFEPNLQEIDEKTDCLRLRFWRPILAGNYTLHFKYTGALNENSNGFYRTSYTNGQNKKVWLAMTNFKPTHARRAFPCFDEPSIRAEFNISIKHFDNYTVFSNMQSASISKDVNDPLKFWTNLQVTPPMSTYQIAFIVSDLNLLSSVYEKFNIYGRQNCANMSKYPHDIGTKELKQLEDYTGFKNVIKTMNIFGIPQLSTNAIENWGIMTFRESALFADENDTSVVRKQSIATLMSQKLANQWFGNLVVPSWWDYAWLNEGFANYFQYYITDKVEPTWRLMEQFVIKNLQETAFVVDDNKNQHAMDVKVNSTQEIAAKFDSVSQAKAGCVIRMISHVLSDTIFRSGLMNYLKKKQLSAATSDDLFIEFVKVAKISPKIPLTNVLDLWVSQPGYPVLTAKRNYTSGSVDLSQKRYSSENTNDDQKTWWIPVNYATQDTASFTDTKSSMWLKPTKKIGTASLDLNNKQWVIFNKKQTGYYRVNYDERNWQLLSDYLRTENYTKIDVLNRAQLLDDSFNLVKSGDLKSYCVFLKLSSYLKVEHDYVPWYAAFRAFEVLDKALVNNDDYDLFQLYIQKLIAKLERTVGYTETPKDDHITKLNRINVIKWACYVGSKNCSEVTHKRLVHHIDGKIKIDADLQGVVLCAGIRSANATTWNKTFSTYEASKDPIERSAIVNALGCSSNIKILKAYLAQTLNTKLKIPQKDIIKAVYEGSGVGINVAFDFINHHYKSIMTINGENSTLLSCLYDIGSRMTTVAQFNKLESFIESLSSKEKNLADALRANALSRVQRNIEWMKKHEASILYFLDNEDLNPTDSTTSPLTSTPSDTVSSTTTPSTNPSSTATSSTTPPSITNPSTTDPSTNPSSTATSSTTPPSITNPSTTDPSTNASSTMSPSTVASSTTASSTMTLSSIVPSPTDPSIVNSSTTMPSSSISPSEPSKNSSGPGSLNIPIRTLLLNISLVFVALYISETLQ